MKKNKFDVNIWFDEFIARQKVAVYPITEHHGFHHTNTAVTVGSATVDDVGLSDHWIDAGSDELKEYPQIHETVKTLINLYGGSTK